VDLSSKVMVAVVIVLVPSLGAACSSDDTTGRAKAGGSRSTTTSELGDHGSTTTTTIPRATSSTSPPTSGPPATALPGNPVAINPLTPVGTGTSAELSKGVTVRVVSSRPFNATAHNPDDIAGPAVAVTLQIDNGSSAAVDLSQLSVSATYGNGVPADENTSSPSKLLSGSLSPGATQQGTYVFLVPTNQTGNVIVSVQSGAAANVPQFRV
jgi:hypothetical protein